MDRAAVAPREPLHPHRAQAEPTRRRRVGGRGVRQKLAGILLAIAVTPPDYPKKEDPSGVRQKLASVLLKKAVPPPDYPKKEDPSGVGQKLSGTLLVA